MNDTNRKQSRITCTSLQFLDMDRSASYYCGLSVRNKAKHNRKENVKQNCREALARMSQRLHVMLDAIKVKVLTRKIEPGGHTIQGYNKSKVHKVIKKAQKVLVKVMT